MRSTLIAAALVLLNALPATAQQQAAAGIRRSNTSKLFVEIAANGGAISVDDVTDGTVSGGGVTFRIGYGLSPTLALFLDASGSSIEGDANYLVGQVDLGVRYHFAAPARAVVPFLEASLTGLSITPEDQASLNDEGKWLGSVDYWGSGFSVGGGVLYFVSPRFALNAGARLTRARMTEVTLNRVTVSGLDLDAPVSRITLGVAWFPMRPR